MTIAPHDTDTERNVETITEPHVHTLKVVAIESYLWSEYIRDSTGLQVQVTVMAIYGKLSLGKKLTHNCLSRLTQEYK